MKVLHVVNISFVLPYYLGEQLDFFKTKGVEFHIACQPSKHLDQYAAEKNFKKVELNILREINLFKDIEAVYKLRKHIKREGIDIVIAHTPKGGLIGMLAAYLAGIDKRIYFRHGLVYETSTGLKRVILKNVERLTGFLAKKVICVSNSVLIASKQNKLSSTSKNIILNKGTCNGLDAMVFDKKLVKNSDILQLKEKYQIKNEIIIGYLGRLVNDKGINELIDAWKILLKERNNIKLLLAGPYEERDSLSESVKKYILNEPSIIQTGLIDDVIPYYAIMDIFILPSYREGFPTVVLEASSMELPVITTRATGCIDSIIEGKTGVFTAIDSQSIYESLKFYLDNPTKIKEHGKAGRAFVAENFEQKTIWENIANNVLELS